MEDNVIKVPPELSEIISDVESGNISTALNKIENIKNSTFYNQLKIRDRMILLDHEIISQGIHNNNELYFELINKLVEDFVEFSKVGTIDVLSKLIYLNYKLTKLIYTDKFEDAKLIINELIINRESILENNKVTFDSIALKMVCKSYHFLAYYYLLSNQLDNGIKILQLRLELAKKMENNYEIFWAYRLLLNFYARKKNLMDFSLYANKSVDYFKNLDKFYVCSIINTINSSLWTLGNIKEFQYNLEKYLDYFYALESLPNSERKNTILQIFYNQNGIIYGLIGKFSESIEWFEKARVHAKILYQNFFLEKPLSSILGNLGELWEEIGNFNEALNLQLQALEFRTKKSDMTGLAESYYQIVPLLISISKTSEAKIYLNNFKSLLEEWKQYTKFSELQSIITQYNITHAIVLIQEKSLKSSLQAQEILKEIILKSDKELIKVELIIDALLPLIELSIQEYKLYQNEKILEDINLYFSKFEYFSEKSNSILFKIRFLMLEARMKLTLGDFDEYTRILKSVRELAKEYDLKRMLEIVDKEISAFQNERQKWEKLQTNSTVKERLVAVEMESYIKFIRTMMHDFG